MCMGVMDKTHRPSPMAPCPASPIARFPPLASPTSTKEFFAQCAHRPRHLAPSHHHRRYYCPHFPFLPRRPQHRVISAPPPSRRLPVILSLSPSRCLLPPLPHRQAALKQQPRPPPARLAVRPVLPSASAQRRKGRDGAGLVLFVRGWSG